MSNLKNGPPGNGRKTAERQQLDELKRRVDLAELVRTSGVELRAVGKNLMGRCPFHDDGEASLSVNPEAQLWNCFGCEAGGDALNFLQLREKLEFPAALDRLKTLARLDAEPRPVRAPAPEPQRVAELMERLAHLYHQRFWEAPAAQEYLAGRGLQDRELAQAFRLGYCDGTVAEKLPTDGPVGETLRQLGLVNADGKEHFRGCLVVPLTHPDRGVVGFYGRRLAEGQTRHLYLPGPRQGVLNWPALKASSEVVLTESVLDALSLWQAGIREVSCLHGVQGLPPDLAELLRRFRTREAVLCLDGDRAGREGTQRASAALTELGVAASALTLPDGQDPNDLLREWGPTRLAEWCARERQGPPETARSETFSEGFLLELGDVHYEAKLLPPFSSRLRLRLRGQRGEAEFLDKVDLYLARSRAQTARELAKALQLQRFEAERHLKLLLEHAERWVQQNHRGLAETHATTPKAELTPAEREDALTFLSSPDLVPRILADMDELGYVGEETPKVLAYFIGLSRKLPKPLSGSIRSDSGVGKSALTELVEFLTPDEEVLNFTRLTGQALYYFPTALSHKLLILEERVGGEAADYSIRVLQSKHKLTQAVPIKDPMTGQFKTQILEVEGPVAYLETTTSARVNYENATRSFEIFLDETEAQTKRIQEAQRRARLPVDYSREERRQAIRRRHHQAQRLLEPVQLGVPYAELLTFPSHRLRTRRDQERFLCLIEASAFLHQHQRQRSTTREGVPCVQASVEDYALAYTLAKEVLAASLHELTRGGRELWEWIRDWVAREAGSHPDFSFTRRDLRQLAGFEDHRLRESLSDLVDMEYLEATGSAGKQFRYRLLVHDPGGVRLPLLTPQELTARWG